MYRIKKTFVISAAHKLALDYSSPCTSLHGHDFSVTVYCRCHNEELDRAGMVVDFSEIKKKIQDQLDHKYLNEVLKKNPTSENIAFWICHQINHCYRVDVEETKGSMATYEI